MGNPLSLEVETLSDRMASGIVREVAIEPFAFRNSIPSSGASAVSGITEVAPTGFKDGSSCAASKSKMASSDGVIELSGALIDGARGDSC